MTNEELLEDIGIVKAKLLWQHRVALIASLLVTTPIKFVEDESITAFTNGKEITFGIEFYKNLTMDDKIFLMAHELWHIALLHCIRGKTLNPKHWNHACDITVNNLLLEKNSGFKIKKLKPIYNKNYNRLTTEEIYKILVKEDNSPKPNENNLLGDIQQSITDSNNGNAPLTDYEEQELINKVKNFSKSDSKLQEQLNNIIEKITKQKVCWKKLLTKYMTELSTQSRSFKKINRRFIGSPFILPSKVGNNKLTHVNFYVDTSGSISDKEIKVFNSEIFNIKNLFNPKTLSVICFDTQIRSEKVIKDTDNPKYFDVYGRGGTCLKPVFEHIKQQSPAVSVIFTDLYVDHIPKKPNNTNVIWLTTGDESDSWRKTPNYGKIINLNLEEYND